MRVFPCGVHDNHFKVGEICSENIVAVLTCAWRVTRRDGSSQTVCALAPALSLVSIKKRIFLQLATESKRVASPWGRKPSG